MRRYFAVCAAVPLLLGAAPPAPDLAAKDVVLDCYLQQSGSVGLGQFVRHLDVRPDQRIVVIADGVRGQPLRYIGTGRILTLDSTRLVYEFRAMGSSGQGEVDRRNGAFRYQDGRRVVSGQCQVTGE